MKFKLKTQAPRFIVLLIALSVGLTLMAGTGWAQHHEVSTSKDRAESSNPNPDPKPESPDALYYDFSDVLVPKQLKLQRDESFVYDTSSFTAGFLTFEGRVEVRSLTQFFVEAMSQDNWLLGAKFTHKEVVLLFEKPNKRSIMYITESRFSTKVRIWVAPFLGSKK